MRIFLLTLFLLQATAHSQTLDGMIANDLSSLLAVYQHLHANPELSYAEEKTAAFLARELRALGYTVTENVGKYDQPGLKPHGIVALLKNGGGPVVLVRTDLDALPVEEKTDLPYASRVRVKNESGNDVSVMHACGHDLHMTSFLGTARMLARLKDRWRGTLMLVGQPAEERGAGAKAMLADGLYTRFARPTFALALHTNASLQAGKIGYCEGYALANVNSVDVVIRGVGGHGAYPHTTKDPIVMAAQVIMALQTIVSREISPLDPAVVTVGSIQGGTKHNIIPDEVRLQLTLRSYKEEVRTKLISSIKRIVHGIAAAAGVPEGRAPIISVNEQEFTPSTYNDPALTRRLVNVLETEMGKENVIRMEPVMGGEDFGRFGLDGQIPVCMFWLGAVSSEKIQKAERGEIFLPSLHSSEFAPVPEEAIRTGVKVLTLSVIELLRK
jgi:amidohydrolase